MGVEEEGRYGAVIIAGTSLFGLLTLVIGALYAWLSGQDYRRLLWRENGASVGEPAAARCHRKRGVARRFIALMAFAAYVVMFITYLLVEFKLGKMNRAGIHINWLYMIGVAVGYALSALIAAQYFWVTTTGRQLAMSGLLGLAFVLLGTGELAIHSNQRILLFTLACVSQFLFAVFGAFFSGMNGPLFQLRGWIVAGPLVAAFVIYDTFWFIGYPNEISPHVEFHARWKTQLPFLLADFLGFVVMPIAAGLLYMPRKSKKLIAAQATQQATQAEQGSASLLYSGEQGF